MCLDGNDWAAQLQDDALITFIFVIANLPEMLACGLARSSFLFEF